MKKEKIYRFILAVIGIFLVETASNIVNIILCVVVFFRKALC